MRSLRQSLRLSQQRLGEALHYSQRLISDIENGKVSASKDFQDAFNNFAANEKKNRDVRNR
ncbi:MAG: helix-turn-helix domain-containing protein [Microcoleus sp.]